MAVECQALSGRQKKANDSFVSNQVSTVVIGTTVYQSSKFIETTVSRSIQCLGAPSQKASTCLTPPQKQTLSSARLRFISRCPDSMRSLKWNPLYVAHPLFRKDLPRPPLYSFLEPLCPRNRNLESRRGFERKLTAAVSGI